MAKELTDLKAKLKKADPEIKLYIAQLEKENARLQLQIAKYQVNQVSLNNRVNALEKEMKENRGEPKLIINTTFSGFDPAMPKETLIELLRKELQPLGYRIEKVEA